MNYLKNHCFCRDSNWGGMYDCSIIVAIDSFEDDEEDWAKIITQKEIFSERAYKENLSFLADKDIDDESIREISFKETSVFNDSVINWLTDNIADYKGLKGWCVGSEDYNSTNPYQVSVFFNRRKDAMLFIKTWSKYKKPIHYCQYFSDVRKTLNLETMKYEIK